MSRVFSIAIAFLVLGIAGSTAAWGQALQVAKPPKLVSAPRLEYPRELKRTESEGVVWVNAIIDTTGHPTRVEVAETPDPRLNEAATRFVGGSVYRPARVDGHNVAMPVRVPVKFEFRRGGL